MNTEIPKCKMYSLSLFADPEPEDKMISLLHREVLMMTEDKVNKVSTDMRNEPLWIIKDFLELEVITGPIMLPSLLMQLLPLSVRLDLNLQRRSHHWHGGKCHELNNKKPVFLFKTQKFQNAKCTILPYSLILSLRMKWSLSSFQRCWWWQKTKPSIFQQACTRAASSLREFSTGLPASAYWPNVNDTWCSETSWMMNRNPSRIDIVPRYRSSLLSRGMLCRASQNYPFPHPDPNSFQFFAFTAESSAHLCDAHRFLTALSISAVRALQSSSM